MKKFIFLIITCVVLAVPCFADNEVYFSNPLTVYGLNNNSRNIICNFENEPGYFYLQWGSEFHNYYKIIAISETANNTFNETDSDTNNTYSYSVNSAFGDYFNYFLSSASPASNITWTPNITVFEYDATVSDINSAFDSFLNGQSSNNSEVTFTLPRGNVLYFKVTANQDVHFESDFMVNSALFSSGTYGPWGDTQQRFGAVSALPNSSTVFPLSSQNPITWYKSPSQNVLGQTKTGRASISCVTNQYYCFYNPAFSYISDSQERDSVGGTVHVNGSFAEIKIYPLSQQLTIENGQVLMNSDSNDGFASYFDGTSNENGTVTFTDQDGNIGLPVNGGQNQQDAPITAQGLIESIKGTLQNILREIESLFTFGYEAIQNLVGTISEFTSVFSQLYTWLPSPVYQALISAIIIAITIGVFKVFL